MITIDWENRIVESTASIVDLPAFKDTVRELECSDTGVLYPPVIIYKKVTVGAASLHAVDFTNGYKLKFIGTGVFVIIGNLNAELINTGVQIEREKSLSFVTVSGTSESTSSGGLTIDEHNKLMSLATKADVNNAAML